MAGHYPIPGAFALATVDRLSYDGVLACTFGAMSQTPPPGAQDGKRPAPTVWIVTAGVCAALAIGFAIWAFTLKSDRDDTQSQLTAAQSETAREQSALSEEERSAAETEAKEKAFGTKFKNRYNAVRDRFIAEEKQADDLKDEVAREKQELAQAQSAEKQAQGQDASLQAQLKTADSRLDLAAACARGSVAALDEFLAAPTVRAGADKALKRLEDLQDQCNEVVKESSS